MASAKPIHLHNTLGRQLQEFRPLHPGSVKLYSCGVTVYNHPHIGNMRAYLFADTLRRMLEYNGFAVDQVRNITDVGHLTNDTLSSGLDKIEATARQQNKTPWDIADYFIGVFQDDARKLNIEQPEHEPRATEYIDQMIELVETLIERGHAYAVDGDVYFAVDSFPDYCKLSGNTIEDLIGGHRVEVGEGKKAPADFALWKFAGPDKIMRWKSPWGDGVPGWHLECSVMAIAILGEQIDIHTGGVDHIFPHHEDEIAQSEAATGKPFSQFWLHNDFLQLAGEEKMSKSSGSFYVLQDIEDRGLHPLALRAYSFQAHYRTKLNFSWEALEAAQTGLVRLWEAAAELVQIGGESELESDAENFREEFHTAINNDLDLPRAMAVLHEGLGSSLPAGQKRGLMRDFDRVLGLDLLPMGECISQTTPRQQHLLAERAQARSEKQWEASDRLRQELAELGLEVKDTPAGQRWLRRDLLPAGGQNHS